MKTIFKKSVAIMLAALILLSAGIAGVTASAFEPAGKLSFETKFFRYDDELGEWVETERAQKGEELKARVYVDTDYFTNSGELLFFYDKDFFTDNYEKNEINVASVNPYYSEACGMEGQLVIYGDGHRAVERMVESGAISADFASEHTAVAMLYSFAIRSENMKLSGEEWLFEFDLTVKEDTLADSGDFFAVATTVQSPDNEHGFVNVPVGKEGEYLEDTEILFGVYVDVEIRKNPVSVKNCVFFGAGEGVFPENNNTASIMFYMEIGKKIYPEDVPTPRKTGYKFAGWIDENSNTLTDDNPVTIGYDYAFFTATYEEYEEYFSLILNANGGAFEDGNESFSYRLGAGEEFDLPDNVERKGYSFAGWVDKKGETVSSVVISDSDVTLDAAWEAEEYTVIFNTDGGDETESLTVACGEEFSLPTASKTGYRFVCWKDESGIEYIAGQKAIMPAEDKTFKAVWEAEEYTVTFNTDGGNEIEALTVTFGEEFTLPSAKKIGHSFAFWRDESGNMYVAGQKVAMPAKDKTFKAVWFVQSKSVTYTIGKETVKFDVVPGNEIPLPDMSVYENAELLYWLDANGKRVEKFPATMPESNLTFTAVLRYTFVDSKYGITASFESGCFDYEGDELDFVVEKFNGVKESGGVYYKDDNYKQIEFYNIKFCHGATTVQPKKGSVVHIGIPVPAAYKDGTEFLVIHRYGGDGCEQITQTKNGDKLKFDVYNFGEFEVCVESGTTVKTSPSKTSYAYKEALDLSGLTLEVLDANGNKAIISDTSKMNVKGYDSKKIGKQTVTVEYDGTTTHFDVSVAYTWWQTLIRILLLGFLWY